MSLLLVTFLFFGFVEFVRSGDQREASNWPFRREYTLSTNISLSYAQPHLIHILSRSSFYVELQIHHDSTSDFNAYVMTDVEYLQYDGHLNETGEESCEGGHQNDRICCLDEHDDETVHHDCYMKIDKLDTTVSSSTNPSTIQFTFNRVSYIDEFVDFNVAVSEFRKLMSDRQDFVLNLRSADHITRVVVLELVDPNANPVKIDKIIVRENKNLERDSTQSILSTLVFSKVMIVVYLGILGAVAVVCAIGFIIIQLIFGKMGKQMKTLLEWLTKFDKNKERLKNNLLITVLFHLKESVDLLDILWEICGLLFGKDKKNFVYKIEEFTKKNTDYGDEVDSDRLERQYVKTPGIVVSWIVVLVLVYFVERVMESVTTRIAAPPNPCSISTLCCELAGTDSDFTYGNVSSFLAEDIVMVPQNEGDVRVEFLTGEFCIIEAPTFTMGELVADVIESRYEKCLYSQHSYPLCRIEEDETNVDIRPLCSEIDDVLGASSPPLIVGNTLRNCPEGDLYSNDFVNTYFMKCVYFLLSLIVVAPFMSPFQDTLVLISMYLTYLLFGTLGGQKRRKNRSFLKYLTVDFLYVWLNYNLCREGGQPEDFTTKRIRDFSNTQLARLTLVVAKRLIKIAWGVVSFVVVCVFFDVVVRTVFRATEGAFDDPMTTFGDIGLATLIGTLYGVVSALVTYFLLLKFSKAVKLEEEEDKKKEEKKKRKCCVSGVCVIGLIIGVIRGDSVTVVPHDNTKVEGF